MMWFFFLGPLLTAPFLLLAVALPTDISFRHLLGKAGFLLLVCGMTLFAVFLTSYGNPHYAAPMTAAIYALVMMAAQRVRHWRIRGSRVGITAVRAMAVIAIALFLFRAVIPVFHLHVSNGQRPETWCSDWNQLNARAAVESALNTKPGQQLVLVHYDPQRDDAWVSNSADIDHSKIVWAHDMGQVQNRELLDYFQNRQTWKLDLTADLPLLMPYEDIGKVDPLRPATAGELVPYSRAQK